MFQTQLNVLVVLVSARFVPLRGSCGGGGFEVGTGEVTEGIGVEEVRRGRCEVMASARSEVAGCSLVATR